MKEREKREKRESCQNILCYERYVYCVSEGVCVDEGMFVYLRMCVCKGVCMCT